MANSEQSGIDQRHAALSNDERALSARDRLARQMKENSSMSYDQAVSKATEITERCERKRNG